MYTDAPERPLHAPLQALFLYQVLTLLYHWYFNGATTRQQQKYAVCLFPVKSRIRVVVSPGQRRFALMVCADLSAGHVHQFDRRRSNHMERTGYTAAVSFIGAAEKRHIVVLLPGSYFFSNLRVPTRYCSNSNIRVTPGTGNRIRR